MKISGFSFVHNAIVGGYPIREAISQVKSFVNEVVVVDMESTDGTRHLLESLGVIVLDGTWSSLAGITLRKAHSQYIECAGDVILHFEADEVYSHSLLKAVEKLLVEGKQNILVPRLQLEQNFQRCRWYPEYVHRVFPNSGETIKEGHTTNKKDEATRTNIKEGFLWDITNCFRDNWTQRIRQQSELWNEPPALRAVPVHAADSFEFSVDSIESFMLQELWTWTRSPFDIPDVLKPLVGKTSYIQVLREVYGFA